MFLGKPNVFFQKLLVETQSEQLGLNDREVTCFDGELGNFGETTLTKTCGF